MKSVITKSKPATDNFTSAERCDANANERAMVQFVTAGGGTLLFCKHHADRYEMKIVTEDGGQIVRDHRPPV